jgi:hypothetical protein
VITHLLSRSSSCLALLGLFLLTVDAKAQGEAASAADLAGKLAAAVEDGDSTTRLRLKIEPVSGGGDTVLQVQIKARRSQGSTLVFYQIFWPKERNSESFLLRQENGKSPEGYMFTPPQTMTTLGKANMSDAVFGSDLSYQDVVENFFRWQNQELAGQETVDRVDCVILDSKPGSGDSTPYSRVRSWIDTRRMVTLRVEKYDASGNVARRITTTRVTRDDSGRNVPSMLVVQRPGSATETEVEGSNLRHDVTLTDEDFPTPR